MEINESVNCCAVVLVSTAVHRLCIGHQIETFVTNSYCNATTLLISVVHYTGLKKMEIEKRELRGEREGERTEALVSGLSDCRTGVGL